MLGLFVTETIYKWKKQHYIEQETRKIGRRYGIIIKHVGKQT